MAWRAQLSRYLKELRIHLCQTSPSSASTRDFILSNYTDLKALNPSFPILIRECSGIEPRIWARYRPSHARMKYTLVDSTAKKYGVEKSVALDGLTADQITEKVKELVRAGAEVSSKTGS